MIDAVGALGRRTGLLVVTALLPLCIAGCGGEAAQKDGHGGQHGRRTVCQCRGNTIQQIVVEERAHGIVNHHMRYTASRKLP